MDDETETTRNPLPDDTATDFHSSSATNVNSEVAKENKGQMIPNVEIDVYDKELNFTVQKNSTGRQLFEQIVSELNLKEVWFFGLEYEDPKGVQCWLKLKKKVFVQNVGKKRPLKLRFRPKFYPEDVEKELSETVSKKLFMSHVKRQILSDEVHCTTDTAVLLASFSLQEECGNYNQVLKPPGFLDVESAMPKSVLEQYELPHQSWEDKIVQLYKDHAGMSNEQATTEYLRIVEDLEMFGVTYFRIKDKKHNSLWLGLDALGMYIYEKANRLEPKYGYAWNEIKALSYREKRFTIKPVDEKSSSIVFYVHQAKASKQILNLCMGNHELYIRRRKVAVAPRYRNSGGRLTEQTIDESLEYVTQYPTEQETRHHSGTNGARHVSAGSSIHSGQHPPESLSDAETLDSHNHVHEDQNDLEDGLGVTGSNQSSRCVSNNYQQHQEQFTQSESQIYATISKVDLETPEPEYACVLEEKNKHSPSRSNLNPIEEQDTAMYENETGKRIKSAVNFKNNSVYEPIGRGAHDDDAIQEHVIRRDSARMREYNALLERYKHGIHDAPPPNRTKTILENHEDFERAKHLFEELEAMDDDEERSLRKPCAKNIETLRKLKSGYARNRVAVFEAMS